jgi:peptidoglycan hydrolase CwlO-like protein
MRYSVLFILCSVLLAGCGIKPTPSQEEALSTLQQELQVAIQENAAIQAGTQAYQENMDKIQAIQEQIQHYQQQIEKAQQKVEQVQQQVEQAQEQVNTIKDNAQSYGNQSKLWINNLKEKMLS